MIDINELRRKANSTDIVDHIDLHANIRPIISELLDRLEAAEKERDDLLKALEWMVLRAEEGGYPSDKCLEEARAAIAKATGDQS